MSSYAKKVDTNQPAIVKCLREAGYELRHLHMVGNGMPDLLVCSKSGINVLLEVKQNGEELTEPEREFHQEWPGPKEIVYDADDAIERMMQWDRMSIRRPNLWPTGR